MRNLQKYPTRLDLDLNQLSNDKMELSIKRCNDLIRLESSFNVHFLVLFVGFCIKVCYNLCHGILELAKIWKLG